MGELYPKAPVVEAVIEIRLRDPLSEPIVRRAHRAIEGEYTSVEEMLEVQVQVDVSKPGAPKLQQSFSGFQMRTKDAADQLTLTRTSLVLSRFAPYDGWTAFFGRFERDWTKWSAVIGQRSVARLGVRFVNRIDVPSAGGVDVRDYLNIAIQYRHLHPVVQTDFHAAAGYFAPREKIGVKFIANLMPPVLLDHQSLGLDIDVFRDIDVPQDDTDIRAVLNRIREIKDGQFEAFCTDKARELFR